MGYSDNNILETFEATSKEDDGPVRCYWYLVLGISFFLVMVLIGQIWGHAYVLLFFTGTIGMVLGLLASIKTWTLSTINSYSEKIKHYLSSNGLKNEVLLATSFGFISKSPKWSFVFERRCGLALTNKRLLVFIAREPGLSLEKTQWQDNHKFDVYSIPPEKSKKVSVTNIFVPPGIALFAKKLVFTPDEARPPISILAFIKFGKNSALLNKVWNRR